MDWQQLGVQVRQMQDRHLALPRFGHNGILTDQQIKDVVAFLLAPDSPVNEP